LGSDDPQHVIVENNITFYNQRNGIYHEISGNAIIRNNIAMFNGLNYDNWLWGSQIIVATSAGSEVYNNTAVVSSNIGNGISVVNQNRGWTDWQSYDNYVHDNTIIYLGESGYSGVVTDYDNSNFWANANNRFDNNTYYVQDDDHHYFMWQDRILTFDQLQDRGQERNGQIIVGIPDGATSVPAWSNNLVAYPAIA